MTAKAKALGLPILLATVAVLLGGYLSFGMEHREAYRENAWNAAVLYAHIAGGSAMVVLGPFLLWGRSRSGRFVGAHRLLGRAYLAGVLFAASGGLYATRLVEYGGAPSRLAFACAFLLWLLTGYLAYRRIREGRVRAHRQWVIRNYAITASFLTHGAWVALFAYAAASAGLDPEAGKTAGDWWAFSANLAVAEVLLSGVLRRPLRGRFGAGKGAPSGRRSAA